MHGCSSMIEGGLQTWKKESGLPHQAWPPCQECSKQSAQGFKFPSPFCRLFHRKCVTLTWYGIVSVTIPNLPLLRQLPIRIGALKPLRIHFSLAKAFKVAYHILAAFVHVKPPKYHFVLCCLILGSESPLTHSQAKIQRVAKDPWFPIWAKVMQLLRQANAEKNLLNFAILKVWKSMNMMWI